MADALWRERAEGRLRPIAGLAGVGPSLYFGRTDARTIPWDPDAVDENQQKPVRLRAWPHSWGCLVWAIAEWDAQPLFLRWELDDDLSLSSLFLGQPLTFEQGCSDQALHGWLRRVAAGEAPIGFLKELDARFWDRLAPQEGER